MKRQRAILVGAAIVFSLCADAALAINGGTLRMTPRNGWKAFEVITVSDNPAGGVNYAMPGSFDGIGAISTDPQELRLLVNHETGDANVSEVNLNLANFQTAIRNMISGGTTGGVSFVTSAQQAYTRWSANAGSSWTNTSDNSTTSFYRFCSSQLHKANAFGPGRGFVDNIYITGEEGSTDRLFALDVAGHDFYQLSGVTGPVGGGNNGMPSDPWENAALLDTGEANHVALLLSPDGGTQVMQLYIGDKGKDATGNTSSPAATSFLGRNGLLYGSYYYLNDALPTSGTSTDGIFATSSAGAPTRSKLEDVDTNPNDPTQAVLGNENYGVFMFDLNFDFSGGSFSATGSSFSITKLQSPATGVIGSFGNADNVDWTAATMLNGISYPNGLIFANEDDSTNANGETWMMTPTAGSARTLIADDTGIAGTSESSGIVDISSLVGYKPGSILLTDVQGSNSSLTVLINPNAALAGDFNGSGVVDAADYALWRMVSTYTPADFDTWRSQFNRTPGTAGASAAEFSSSTVVPEPCTLLLVLAAAAICGLHRRRVKRSDAKSSFEPFLSIWAILSGSFAAAATTNEITQPFAGVRLIHSHATVPREIDMWIAEIDLSVPGISFLVTPSNGELPGDTAAQTVRSFATQAGAQLGINGSFFSMAGKGPDGKPQSNVTGLSVSKGDAYSPFARGFEEAINISPDGVATLIRGGDPRSVASAKRNSKQKAAVARQAKSPTAKVIKPSSHVPGTVPAKTKEINIGLAHEPAVPLYNALSGKTHLVEDGENVAADDAELHPRTAVGIKADGKLLLFTVDGREPGRSMGLTLGEMADALIHFGARDAISLDGGGSTTFVMDDPATPGNDPQVMNLPSDAFSKANEGKEHGKERAVANGLVVFARKKPLAKATLAADEHEKESATVGRAVNTSSCESRPRCCCCKCRHFSSWLLRRR